VSLPDSTAALIAAYYVFYWGAFGIFLPYFSLWLVGRGVKIYADFADRW